MYPSHDHPTPTQGGTQLCAMWQREPLLQPSSQGDPEILVSCVLLGCLHPASFHRGFKAGFSQNWRVNHSVMSSSLRPHRIDCGPPGSSVHETLQARILEWVAISSSRGSSKTQGLNPGVLHNRQLRYLWTTREAKIKTVNESTSQRTPYHNQNKNWKLGQGTSLMIQWLRIHLAIQGARVWSLVGELRSHLWAIKPAHCSKGSLCDAARESPRNARKTQLSSKQRRKRTEASKNVNESSGWGVEGCSQDSRSTAVAQK